MTEQSDHGTIYAEFKEVVNMTASALEKHLKTAESRSVGQKQDGDEATGHAEGRRIVAILHKNKSQLSEDDYGHMRKVVGYVRRHLKQGGPRDKAEIEHSPWRLSLMNWGHDPTKAP